MSIDGQWDTVTKTPMGPQKAVLTLKTDGTSLTGTQDDGKAPLELFDGSVNGDTVTYSVNLKVPFAMKLQVTAKITGDTIEGTVKAGMLGTSALTGTRKV